MSNLNLRFRQKYGRSWPAECHDIFIDLLCAKCWREPAYKAGQLLRPGEHLLRAIRALFTHDQWSISAWTEAHAHGWCEEETLGIIGCASSSKSNDIGGFCLLDWICHPTETITIMASTSKYALADRSYESVLRYFKILKSHPTFMIPGKESKTTMAIINDDADDYGKDATAKAAIRGVAVQEGSADEARANLQGRHMPYVRLICDEFAGMRKAAADARINLRIGASRNFKWCFLANPDSLFDLSAQFSEPADGWSSVDENTPSWRTKTGALILHHNGFHSPAVLEPDGEKKYPYLINQAQIDATIRDNHGNEDCKDVWTMVKGFPPRNLSELTVLSGADLQTFHMQDPPVWDDRGLERIRVAGLDPAFTSGGDGCVFQAATIGLVREGTLVCAFDEPQYVSIRAASARPAAYQVVDGTLELCRRFGVPIAHLAVDDSGTQSVADIVAVESGVQPLRCDFGASASDLPLSSTNLTPAKDRFGNRVTEIWLLLAELGRCGQLRGLPAKAAQQFCTRRFKPSGKLRALESKKEFKKRLAGQRSPDEGDAAALCVLAARLRAGLRPGFNALDSLQTSGAVFPRLGGLQLFTRSSLRSSYNSVDDSRFSVYRTPCG